MRGFALLKAMCFCFLLLLFASLARAGEPAPPFGYGFSGGAFYPNEDAAISTWNDIHYGCHFVDKESLQVAIDEIDSSNGVLIVLHGAWSEDAFSCRGAKPWGDADLFIDRISPLLDTLFINRSRLFAIKLFDEPDVPHGGPQSSQLIVVVDYLHEVVPDVPVFINWFKAKNNLKVPNVDWHSTTKGKRVASLARYGKPMFLWWFHNQRNPSVDAVMDRWDDFVAYYDTDNDPPIAALGWCCDSIENYPDYNNNAPALNDFLAAVGRSLKEGKLYGWDNP